MLLQYDMGNGFVKLIILIYLLSMTIMECLFFMSVYHFVVAYVEEKKPREEPYCHCGALMDKKEDD